MKEIYSTKLVTPKKIGFMTFENVRLLQSLGLATLNVTTTLDNDTNYQLNLNDGFDNSKNSTRPRFA